MINHFSMGEKIKIKIFKKIKMLLILQFYHRQKVTIKISNMSVFDIDICFNQIISRFLHNRQLGIFMI